MTFLLISNLKDLGFRNKNRFTGETDIRVSTFNGEHKIVETITGFVPEENRIEERSKEERILSAELKDILKTGLSVSNCRRGLDLLDKYESLVKTSWTHTLNRSRLLRVIGQSAEAEGLAFDVIKRFPSSKEAVGIAYEVLSFIEEFKEPKEKGVLYQQWLEKRRDYVMEGLKFFPTGHDLLMNAFEVATLQEDAEEVLIYLVRAIAVDKERTRENLKVNPLTREAMGLSPKVKKAITDLIKGENRMKAFEMVKIKTLILVLVIAAVFGLLASISLPEIKGLQYGSVFVQSEFSGNGGTGIGAKFVCSVKTGTGIG
jgi:hypothetical protein